jgi:hypothetical protein
MGMHDRTHRNDGAEHDRAYQFDDLELVNPSLGSAEDLARLPPWELLEHALTLDLPATRVIYVWGPPGVGKTYGAYNFGRIVNGFYACTLTDETSAAELRGHFIFKGGDALWHDGPFVRAMREGKRLVINEVGNANADVLAMLFPILESAKTAELTLPTGETIQPAAGFHVVCTDNCPPDQLPEALDDRFGVYVRVSEPHPDAIASIHPQLREFAVTSAGLDPDRRVSARGWLSLQSLIPAFGLEAACNLTFGPDRGPLLCESILMARRGKVPKSKKARKTKRG